MRKHATALVVIVAALIAVSPAQAHLAYKVKNDTLKEREHVQTLNLAHAKYVCHRGRGEHKRWACKAQAWIARELAETQQKIVVQTVGYWAAKQIWLAEQIGSTKYDHWPNCPDPYDGSGSWSDTVACENGGNWLDSAGYYRCGLQFDPGWEERYNVRVCP